MKVAFTSFLREDPQMHPQMQRNTYRYVYPGLNLVNLDLVKYSI